MQKRKKKTSCASQMERLLFLPTNAEMGIILFSGAEFENGRNLWWNLEKISIRKSPNKKPESICANEKKKKKNNRRARCRCARSNERGNVLGLRLRSHSDCYQTTGFHFGGCSHLCPVPCALEEVSYPLQYVAFILTRRDGLFSWPLCVHTCRWIPTYT